MAGRVEESKMRTPLPKYLFAGLYLAGILIVSVLYSQWTDGRDTAEYIADPQRRDLYVVETAEDPEYPNIIMRVSDVKGDSVEMMVGSYVYSSVRDAVRAVAEGELDEPGYFVEEKIDSRQKLRRLYDLKKIARIIREEE